MAETVWSLQPATGSKDPELPLHLSPIRDLPRKSAGASGLSAVGVIINCTEWLQKMNIDMFCTFTDICIESSMSV